MDIIKLIALYCYICERYDTELCWHCQRFSNNAQPVFTDQELLTIYVFCVAEEEKFKVKAIYKYARKYLHDWFPKLPSYQAFSKRLNRLAAVFPVLAGCFLQDVERHGVEADISLMDSLPIITCSGKRAGKVAPELTDKGFCSTKNLYYYGAKLHSIAFRRSGTLPLPEFLTLTPASENDLNAVRHILPGLENRAFFGDKIFSSEEFNQALLKEAGSCIYTPVKLVKGENPQVRQFKHAADKLFSTAVSRVRQPIESFFNWLIEIADIQRASKVRSLHGFIVHVFGKIAAAISTWLF